MLSIENIASILYDLSLCAFKKGEIPVSAIVIHNNKVNSKAYNLREKNNDITAHAEILSLKKAAKKLKTWNSADCEMYVSLKPCKMCEEVIKQSRIKKVYYLLDKLDYKHDYDKTSFNKVINNDFSDSYQQLLSDFFQNKRQ